MTIDSNSTERGNSEPRIIVPEVLEPKILVPGILDPRILVPRILVLWADDNSANLGVRALAQGTAALVRQTWPAADVVFRNFGTPGSVLPTGRVRSMVRERVTGQRGTMAWLAGFDLVVDTRSGDSFADIYGLRRLRIMSGIAELAAQAGTPVILGPQTIGPFDTVRGRLIARYSMKRAAATIARDRVSADHAAALGRPVDLRTSDVVFALPSPPRVTTRDVVLNISGLLWGGDDHVDSTAYRATVIDLVARLKAEGRAVSLLAHVLDSPVSDNDVPALTQFAQTTGFDGEIIIPTGLEQVREVAASARVVMGSRMHACLNALSVGTPAIPLAYSRKFEPLLADIGWHHSVDLRSSPDAAAEVMRHLDSSTLEPEALATRAAAVASLVPASGLLQRIVPGITLAP